jgi:putative membrane protein
MNTKLKIPALSLIFASVLILKVFSNTRDKFFDKASQFHQTEIQAGKLAEKKGNPEVVKLGTVLVKDNTIARNELHTLAQKRGLKIVPESDTNQKKNLANLRYLSGKAFDSAFMVSQFLYYKQGISLFTEESKTGIDPVAREYAGKYLPKLQMHLQMFQGKQAAVKTTMDSAGKK